MNELNGTTLSTLPMHYALATFTELSIYNDVVFVLTSNVCVFVFVDPEGQK